MHLRWQNVRRQSFFSIVFDDEVCCKVSLAFRIMTCLNFDLLRCRQPTMPPYRRIAHSAALQAENSFCTILLKVNETVHRK